MTLQPFVIDNHPGASGNIGTELIVRSAPDGYTLLLEAAVNVINDRLVDKLGFNFMRDIAPVAGPIAAPLVLEVNPAVPARTVPEFIAYAKANPGKINMVSAGNGTSQHVASELFKMMASTSSMCRIAARHPRSVDSDTSIRSMH
jgi:tripartite-type tricarboxylate transporter receptor subunit TctC